MAVCTILGCSTPPPANASFTVADITAAYHGEDDRNNIEQVTLWVDDVAPADWAGEWTVRVSADSLPVGPQPYSLVGEWRNIELPNVYPLDAGFHQAPELLIIPVAVSNPHLAASGASGGLKAEDWAVRVGDSGSNSWSEATVEATYGPVGDQAFLVVRPPNTLDAGIHYDLEVTLLDVYQIDQHTAESQQDIATATQNNALIFSASPRPPVDEMIIMDNSGSMASNNKLDSAQNAARAFADRRQEGDMIGLAYFEDIADTLYDLTLISADESELAAVKQQIDSMTADGATALGAGLLEGKAQLDSNGNPDHTANIVLLSDGMENVSPCWDSSAGNPSCEGQPSVQDDFVPANGCPSIRIDTVTIGPENATWHQLLEDVADKTCGEPWQATVEEDGGLRASLGGTQYFPQALQNTLADIYISIADGNTHQERLWEALHILEVSEQISHLIELEDNLPEATFALNFSEITSAPFVQLYRPSGDLVNLNDPDVHINSDLTHVVYRIDAPTGGTWRLEWMNTNSNSVPAEYLATVSANTNVTMLLDFGIAPPERIAGATMPLYVILADEAGTLTDAQVELRIRQPGGQLDFLTMYDDGTNGDATANDGVYSNHYLIPATGNYRVKAFAKGIAHDNEPFMRYRQRHFRAPRLPSVAYIYDSQSEIATQYKNLLDGNGMNVTLIKQSEIENTDFEPYHLILIGPETGTEDNWGNQSQIELLTEDRKRILGLGEGGYAFFGKLGLDIGYPNGMNASDSEALPLNPTQPIWSQPYEIEIQSGFVSLYDASGSPGIVLDLLQSGPTVERIAQRPSVNDPFDWLASEQSLYFFWGFDRGPDAMTETGQELFVNVAWDAQE